MKPKAGNGPEGLAAGNPGRAEARGPFTSQLNVTLRLTL
jgi:hypothetical protein